jgi:hypothetical protein
MRHIGGDLDVEPVWEVTIGLLPDDEIDAVRARVADYGAPSESQPSLGMRATMRKPAAPSGRITAASPSAR